MKTTLIVLLGVFVLVAASAFATETRTMVMGENNMIMVDDANIWLFPGRVNNYPNLVLGEFGNGDELYNLGVTWQFNEENPWVLGTFVSTSPTYGPYSFWGNDLARFPYYDLYYEDYATVHPSSVNELSYWSHPKRMSILYGRKLGGQNFGFGLDVVKSSWEAKEDSGDVINFDANPKQSFHMYTLRFGLTEAASGKWDLGLTADLGGWTNEDPEGNVLSEPSGYYDLAVSGRMFMVRNPKVTLVPHATFAIGKRGAKYPDVAGDPNDYANDDAKVEYSATAFDLGMGMNYTPAPNMLAVVDFGISYSAVKAEHTIGADIVEGANYWDGWGDYSYTFWDGTEKDSYFVLPYMKIGFEGEVFSWMDVRAGGYTTLWSNKEKWESDFDVDETWNTASQSTYFGFGFNWGKLYLDTETDPELLLKGFDFISGNDGDGYYRMNWRVSMLYEMF
jgi:hypothetical protein